MKKLLSIFLFTCLFLGIQQTSNAQLRVFNGTTCTLYVYAGQAGPPPCSLCATSGTMPILPGQSIQFPVDPTCGPEFWKGIGFSDSPIGPAVGYTYNQTVPVGYTCTPVPNISGLCGATTINGLMLGGGLGPQTIVIF